MIGILMTQMAFAAEEIVPMPRVPLRWTPKTEATYRYGFTSEIDVAGLGHVDLTLDAECRAQLPDADRFTFVCDARDVALGADGVGPEQDRLARAAATLEGATITAQLSRQGRLMKLDVVPARGGSSPVATQLAAGAFAGLDLELPPNPLSTSWAQRRTALMPAASSAGPLGRADLVHARVDGLDDDTLIESRGRTFHLFVDAALRPTEAAEATLASVARFDGTLGVLTERVWQIESDELRALQQSGRLVLHDVRSPLADGGER